ncbi:hypothetical protein K502DRAFT_76636 [Neoconidiobolus thromboides FSU 785]|nr:hypothetical protein K502DRAFT_76636 [Neoconidiobolus thromboides FSU 785]
MQLAINTTFSLGFEIFLFIYSLLSITLNGLVLFITYKRSKTNKAIDGLLIQLISLFDIIIALFLTFTQLYRWITVKDSDAFEQSMVCTLSSIIFNSTIIVALSLTSQLSIIRYLAIVKSYSINNTKTKILSFFTIVLIISGFTVAHFFGTPKVMPSGLFCITAPIKLNRILFSIYGPTMLIVTFLIIMSIPVFYCMITLHYYYINQKLKAQVGDLRKVSSFYKSHHVLYLFLVSFCYILSLMPELILLIVETTTKFKRDYTIDSISLVLLFSETVINPLFVLTLHPDSRNELVALLKGGNRSKIINGEVSSSAHFPNSQRNLIASG